MKLLVTGSRKLSDESTYEKLESWINSLNNNDLNIIHGGAVGVDTLVSEYASTFNYTETIIRPDYESHGKAAPLIRNTEMVGMCDEVLAIYAPNRIRQGGTWDTVKKALSAGKKVSEMMPDGQVLVTEPPASLF